MIAFRVFALIYIKRFKSAVPYPAVLYIVISV